MARGFTSLLTVLLLAGATGFGQIIIPGVGYPGGGYPGGGNSGRRNPQGGRGGPTQGRESSATTLIGILRNIGEKNIVIEAEDQTISTISIGGSAKYIGPSGGSAKIGDFQPGDHVSVSANQDNNHVYKAVTLTMVKEGTPEEHSIASVAADDTSHPLPRSASTPDKPPASSASSSSAGSNNPDRPKLRRAASSSDDITSSSSSNAPNDNDPDRPRLRRAASSSDAGVANSSNSSSNSSSDDRPRMRRAVSGSDDSTPRAEITTGDSATTAARAPRNSSRDADNSDSGPPRLRRGTRPAADSDTVVADGRPSLHADDINGVTRMPSAPRPGDPSGADSRRMPSTGDPFIDQTREAAFSFSETLPNYVVKQYTTRYETAIARGGKTSWQVLDNVTADVIEENGEEKYKNILVNGKPPREDVEKTGSWSRGEFSSLLQDVLSPFTNADFHGKRSATIVNRAAFRYDFSVEQPNSHWHVESESQTYLPGYTGAIWIDKENYRVLRIEMAAQPMPRSFPLDTVESAVDYDYVAIGDSKYLLPVHSEALSCARGTSQCSRNVIEFRNYRKFTADTNITFEADK